MAVYGEPGYAWWRDPWWQETLLNWSTMGSPVLGDRCRQCDAEITREDGQTQQVRVHVCRVCRQLNVERLCGDLRKQLR